MADDPMPPAGGPPDKAGKKGGGGLGAWIKRNPGPAAAGGLGGGLLLFMLLRKGSNQPADTGATSAPTAGPDPAAYGTSGDLGGVYGQPDFATRDCNFGGVSATSLCGATGIAVSGNWLFVSDYGNNRILEYNGGPNPPTNVTANLAFGGGLTAAGVCGSALTDVCPYELAVDDRPVEPEIDRDYW